jgi:hypothetical protein
MYKHATRLTVGLSHSRDCQAALRHENSVITVRKAAVRRRWQAIATVMSRRAEWFVLRAVVERVYLCGSA